LCCELSADEMPEAESDVLVLRRQPRWVDELMRDVSNSSPGKQIAIGGVSGLWVFTFSLPDNNGEPGAY